MFKLPIAAGVAAFIAVSLSAAAHGESLPGLHFWHHDWEVACDNTRTCRAAGYQADDGDALPMSVLLTRKAGGHQSVSAQLQLGDYDSEDLFKKLPPTMALTMKIDGRAVGKISIDRKSLIADLPPKQVDALIAALKKDSEIAWSTGDTVWNLSGKGAAAVLLKMDEFQGRIGTTGALMRKGPKSEDAVLPPLPVPVVTAAPIAKPKPGDDKFVLKHMKALIADLRATLKEDECEELANSGKEEVELSATRLSNTRLLVSARCWTAAYNMGYGYWVVNETAPFAPVLVTTNGTEFSGSSISSAQKGRGLGDCWGTEEWTWDGKRFVQTSSATSGMCKLVAPGGAWQLPVLVTDVRGADTK